MSHPPTTPSMSDLHRLVEHSSGLTSDSRQVTPGALFCALPGSHSHGLDHHQQAQAQGASALLYQAGGAWSAARSAASAAASPLPWYSVPQLRQQLGPLAARFYRDPSRQLHTIGITGTNGKTSTAWIIAHLSPAAGFIGTLGSGIPPTLTPTHHTTPEPIELQRLLAELVAQGATTAALEVSSHGLDQQRVAGITFRSAILTNITRDHLDYHPTLEHYIATKAQLFAHPDLEHGIYNLDDPTARRLYHQAPTGVQRIGYSLHPPGAATHPHLPDLWAEQLQPRPGGCRLTLAGAWGRHTLEVPLLGHFALSNLLAALTALLLRGDRWETLQPRLATLPPIPGRMQLVESSSCHPATRDQPQIVVDYAHTPDALQQVLQALRQHTSGRLLCLFGCGGNRDSGKRPLMGAIAEQYADQVILTDDNPRHEEPATIIEQIRAGMERPDAVEIQHDRRQAIAHAIAHASAGDLLLVAGKGHEQTQQIGDVFYPFSDLAVIRQLLAPRSAP